MNEIEKFIKRLEKIGVSVELNGNFPWVYLTKINGKTVTERFMSEHGFTLGYSPTRKNQKFRFENLEKVFWLIRLYS